jgi:hypothetical protein
MDHEQVRQAVSDADGGRPRGRAVRAHLRECHSCRDFQALIAARHEELRALAPPLPVAAAAALVKAFFTGGGGAGGGGAGGLGAGAADKLGGLVGGGKLAGTSAGAKFVAVAATTLAVGGTIGGVAALVHDGEPGNRPARDTPGLSESEGPSSSGSGDTIAEGDGGPSGGKDPRKRGGPGGPSDGSEAPTGALASAMPPPSGSLAALAASGAPPGAKGGNAGDGDGRLGLPRARERSGRRSDARPGRARSGICDAQAVVASRPPRSGRRETPTTGENAGRKGNAGRSEAKHARVVDRGRCRTTGASPAARRAAVPTLHPPRGRLPTRGKTKARRTGAGRQERRERRRQEGRGREWARGPTDRSSDLATSRKAVGEASRPSGTRHTVTPWSRSVTIRVRACDRKALRAAGLRSAASPGASAVDRAEPSASSTK